MSEIQALERLLHHDIPLTGDMGLRVRAWDNHCLRLHVPLAPNVNHKSTMFGGSLYCAAVLAGWGWLHLRLGEAGLSGGHIVIQQGQIDYPLPVAGDALAVCENIDEALWQRFLKTYRRHGRARLQLQTQVLDGERCAVTFSGQYVVVAHTPPAPA
ncbi:MULTISPECIES: thioesterase domain-containing protein [Pseudomonas]|jgi:thioesterase domain-containing protein|uniref:Thioesterase domain-containing protein n=1 Tax=Pseudomonas coleopterorum TaxID=1605838 RepID=A0AAJ6M0K8_9PSED|nr:MULTISPECIES: thioesterase domain-containing protein [Pseudomonas]KNC10772.1 thioesterase [Pseudomonas sp. RIT-PI-a]MBD8756779.1 thioesterase domain-containing protein [Pseudomonas coleopterorum]MBD8769332.1 thioesterase domain-containing protein [Pseudomonas coleopterorum]MDY1048469.1 thioesterase domain-containing protein [Pseudomonas coleopterorum]WNC10186.1 thioesterase domain-containing protein [Pseudomonas coleopterorum]